jgi:sodium/potassium/calcium exchanger 6
LFVREHCKAENTGRVNYLEKYYCYQDISPIIKFIGFLVWLGLLFVALAVTANDFITTNIEIIAVATNLSENLAGATLLALGNGSPDVFSTFTAIRMGEGSLAIGELIGAASIVTAALVGTLAVIKPFKVTKREFLRDLSFFAGAAIFVIAFVADGQVTLSECWFMFAYWLCYCLCLWLWTWLEQRREKKHRENMLVTERTRLVGQRDFGTIDQAESANRRPPSDNELRRLERIRFEGMLGVDPDQRPRAKMALQLPALISAVQFHSIVLSAARPVATPPAPIVPTSKRAVLFPKLQNFWDQSPREKAFSILATPPAFFLTITTPVTKKLQVLDGESYVWIRWLTVLQCLTAPVFVVFALSPVDSGLPLIPCIICTVISVVCLVTLFSFTTADRHPSWISPLTGAGFVVGIIWINFVASEVVIFFTHVGIILRISKAILGLTAFALGNSIGDFLAATSIAQKGSPFMAFTACFGGPMFNLLFGIGLGGVWNQLVYGGSSLPINVEITSTLVISAITLLLTIVVFFLWIPANGFWLSRSFGVSLVTLWLTSTIVNVGMESYGLTVRWPDGVEPRWSGGVLWLVSIIIMAAVGSLMASSAPFDWIDGPTSF